MPERDFYSVTEAAEIFGVKTATLRLWIREKKVPATRPHENANWRISRAVVEARMHGDNDVGTGPGRPDDTSEIARPTVFVQPE